MRAGASGYLVKDSAVAELLAAVRALHAGQGYFGPQAARVLAEQLPPAGVGRRPLRHASRRASARSSTWWSTASTTKEVARDLGISVKTADNHRCRLMEKLGVHNTAELVRYAARRGCCPEAAPTAAVAAAPIAASGA